MTTTPTELKPCPFCAGPAKMIRPMGNRVFNWDTRGKQVPPYYGPGWFRLVCANENCHVVTRACPTEAEAIAAWNTRAPAVGGVRVKPLEMAGMLSRNAGNTEGAPEWIRVAQDGEGMHGGFWTCAAATEDSPQYIRADLVRKALEPQAVDDAMVERATHLLEWLPSAYHHCKHGTQDWCESYLKNAVDVIRAQDARIAALTAALQAAKEPSHD